MPSLRAPHSLTEQVRQLNLRKERECLEIARVLDGFSRSSEQVGRLARAAAGILSGPESSIALKGLVEMVDRLGRRMEAWERDAASHDRVLEGLVEVMGKATDDLGLLKAVARDLNMLGIATRIQSSRLGRDETSFNVLADEIFSLSRVVGERSASLGSRSLPLRRGVEGVLARLRAGMGEHREQSEELLRTSRAVTGSLDVLGAASVRAAESVFHRLEAINRSVGEVVVALQYEDISRQKIEEGLSSLSFLPGGGRPPTACFATLEEARGMILAQGDSVKRQFAILEEMITLLARETSEAQASGVCFLAELEKGTAGVAAYLSAAMATGRERADDLGRTADDTGAMSTHLTAVEDLGDDIGLLALNARIQAAHLGEGGAGLRVVAESIQRVALHSNELAARLSREMSEIGAAATGMGGELRQAVERDERELGGMIRELGTLLEGLRVMQKRVLDDLIEVRERGNRLAGEVAGALRRYLREETSAVDLDLVIRRLRERLPEPGEEPPGVPRHAAGTRTIQPLASRGEEVVFFTPPG